MKFLLVLTFLIAFSVSVNASPPLEKVEGTPFLVDVSAMVFSGASISGEAIVRTEVVYENPDPEILWGFPLNYVWYTAEYHGNLDEFKGISGSDSTLIFDRLVAASYISQSTNFGIATVKKDEWGVGVFYNPEHWKFEWLPDMRIYYFVMEGNQALILANFKKNIIAPGYFILGELEIGMENMTTFNPDYRDFRIAFRKDTDPKGDTWIEAFYQNRYSENIVGIGAGMVAF